METINWKIEGMSCSTCALTIGKYLEKKGFQNVKVSLASGDVSFESLDTPDRQQIQKGIHDLGYNVVAEETAGKPSGRRWNRHLVYLLLCAPFTAVLLLHMVPGVHALHWLMAPWVQLTLCLPVYGIGMYFFGRSAVNSILNGLPNMNVLIAAGATAAFLYSLTGTLLNLGPAYLFYETTASIITIVFLGYYIEDASILATQRSLNRLARSQITMANMIAFDDQHQEILFPVENTQLRSGDLVLIRSGEQVPTDCLILWGEASVDESIITGESLPVDKKAKDTLIGGSVLISGSAKAQVSAATADSVLAGIVRMVQQAQGEKPPIQQLADRISAVFVPLVLGIAILTFFGNYIFGQSFAPSLMRSIAVLVIACPCAMGLATPAAIAVGLGRAARQGILFRNARHLESFKNIRQVVFDKTGTLTTGEFTIRGWKILQPAPEPTSALTPSSATVPAVPFEPEPALTETAFRHVVCSLEKYSNHPIASSIVREWQPAPRQSTIPVRSNGNLPDLRWQKVEEVKGLGMRGETKTGDVYWAGSYKVAAALTTDNTHSVYVVHNDRLLGWIDTGDAIRPEAVAIVKWLHGQKIRTVLLSGDRLDACQRLAQAVGIQEVLAEQTPEQKLSAIARLDAALPTAMVGDGINDAPALARATIGISMSDASQLAMQTADVVLLNHGLLHLPAALQLGRQTFVTIRQNLFWAFFYNVFAIPVAALGWLTPAVAALAMGFSDVVLAFNSLRLYVKKID